MGSVGSKKPASSHYGSGSSSSNNATHDAHAQGKYLNPTGLYPTCQWDLKTIRKLILEKKLAPFYPGREEKDSPDLDECPICFMFYVGGLNRTMCCRKGVCTECFLQIKKPGAPLAESICPFCNRSRFTVVFLGPKTREERIKEEQEDQRVLELQEKMRQEEIERDLQRAREKQKQKDQDLSKEASRQSTPDRTNTLGVSSSGTSGGIERRSVEHAASSSGSVGGPQADSQFVAAPTNENTAEQDLDDFMLMEAIRLSLMESNQKTAADMYRSERSSSPSPEDSDDNRADDYRWAGDNADFDIDIPQGGLRSSSGSGECVPTGTKNPNLRKSLLVTRNNDKEKGGEESDKDDDEEYSHYHHHHHQQQRHNVNNNNDNSSHYDESALLLQKRRVSSGRSSSSSTS